eukprot:11465740-Karenia_brevis.AAC.1
MPLQKAVSETSSLQPSALTLHFDCWSDRWSRVWVLGILWWLKADGENPWSFRRCAFAFEKTSAWSSDDAGSQHCAATAATALRAAAREAGLQFSGCWACSDSAPAAVATSRLLGLTGKRCLVHLFGIPIQRLLFAKKPKGSRILRQAPAQHPAPAYFMSFEKLRAVCLSLADADVAAEFARVVQRLEIRDGHGDLIHVVPVDSSAKWGSTATMGHASVAARPVLEHMAGSLPELPSPAEWELISESLAVLDVVQASVAKLQGDSALLASYMPISAGLCRVCSQRATPFSTLYLENFKEVEKRNIGKSLDGPLGGKWDCLRTMACCASLLHPRYRSGWYLTPEEKQPMLQRAWQHCLSQHMLANNMASESHNNIVEYFVPSAQPHGEEPRLRGMMALEEAMGEISGQAPVIPYQSRSHGLQLRQATLSSAVGHQGS